MNFSRWVFVAAFLSVVLIASITYAQTILWEQDCFGVVGLTPIPGGDHVVCEEEPTATPSPTPFPTPVPSANQLLNPCFDGPHNGDPLEWEQTDGWDTSTRKNPCGENGTAARIAEPGISGESAPGIDEYIWQVVPGNGGYLVAEIDCTHIGGEVMDYNVYGAGNENGPWELLWKPFDISGCYPNGQWNLRHAETSVSAHDWYKVEVHARFIGQAVKVTSIYFESR